MKLFRKKEKKTGVLPSLINRLVERLQSKWAVWMNLKTAGISTGRWKIMLIVFVMVSSAASIYVAVSNLTTTPKNEFKAQSINVPLQPSQKDLGGMLTEPNEFGLTSAEKLRSYFDSLAQSPEGVKTYDSILHLRPGLLDSVKMMENIYK